MNADLNTALAVSKSVSTQQSIATAVVKMNAEMEQSIVNMIDAVARSAPAPDGQGLKVDKSA
ncbi:hypothetical protein [Devosia sp.]|uniref:hypothetical protein n=1 Tax=Devosia sp. TaxID=1871048 RepID=UPI003A913B52